MSYECHITTLVKDAEVCELIARAEGWKTSEIKRDPILGDGSHFYLTCHSTDFMEIFGKMKDTANKLGDVGVQVLRKKIEHIIYDSRTAK